MKGIKLLLLGISFILFFVYADSFMNTGAPNAATNLIIGIGAFSPIVGMILCIWGFFKKD